MKTLKDTIIEKLIINKDTSVRDKDIDKVFYDEEELVETLNNLLEDELEKPIKIYPEQAEWYTNADHSGLTRVHHSFSIKKKKPIKHKDNLYLIRGGLQKGELILQGMYEKYLGDITLERYKFGEDNFKEWIATHHQYFGFCDFFHIPQVNLG